MYTHRIVYKRLVNTGNYENFSVEMEAVLDPEDSVVDDLHELSGMADDFAREELERRGLRPAAAQRAIPKQAPDMPAAEAAPGDIPF